MKKLSFACLVMLMGALFYNCEDAPSLTVPPAEYVTFEASSATVPVQLNGTGQIDIKVYSTREVTSAKTFNVTVDESSSAVAASYTLPSTVVIPANSNEGTLSVSFVDEGISNSGETLVINLSAADGDVFVGGPITLNVVRDCPSDLAGTYIAVSNGTSTDAAPVNNPLVDFSYQVTVTKTDATSYTISDGVAGVYQDWYCAPYGYCFETEGNFTDTCGVLTGSWVEAFGSTINLTGTDNFDGTLTISWVNGFGDTATATYTKQ